MTAATKPKQTFDSPMPTGKRTAKKKTNGATPRQVQQGTAKPPVLSQSKADRIVPIPLEKLHNHPANPDPTEQEILRMTDWLNTELKQLEPLTVRPLKDPIGHFQILAGKTRYLAAKRIGWATLDCRIRRDLDDEALAIEVLAGTNQQRRTETPIRQALMIQAMIDAGKSLTEAGAMYGLNSESAARNKLQLLKLPEPWRGRVISGEMPETAARQLVPYVEIKQLMKIFNDDYKRAATNGWADELFAWTRRESVADTIDDLVHFNSRGLEEGDTWHYGWNVGDHGCLFEVTPALEKKLQVVSVPMGKNGAMKRLALNVKAYDKINKPLAEKAAETNRSRKKCAKKVKKAVEVTPAQKRAAATRKKKEAAKRTAEAVKVWRHRFLRCLIFRAIKSGAWETAMLLPIVMAEARQKRNEWHNDPAPLDDYLDAALRIQAHPSTKLKGRDLLGLAEQAIRKDGRDDEVAAVEDVQMLLLKFLIWPQCEARPKSLSTELSIELPQTWRKIPFDKRRDEVFLLQLDYGLIERIAKLLKVKAADGWKRAAIVGSRERVLFMEFLDLHTKDQLLGLATEIGGKTPTAVDVENAKNKGDAIDAIMRYHLSKQPLKMPKSIEAVKK